MKKLLKNLAVRLWPELESKTYFPQIGIVCDIPDAPADGGTCTASRPRYAVNVQLLRPDLTLDTSMPILRDVPVAMPGAAPERGFFMLPQIGTYVEIAFAFGRLSQPFIRSVLPMFQPLPTGDSDDIKIQQSCWAYSRCNGDGEWLTVGAAIEHSADLITQAADMDFIQQSGLTFKVSAGTRHLVYAPQIWLGSETDNLLQMISDDLTVVAGALSVLASHTHPQVGSCEQGNTVNKAVDAINLIKTRVEAIKANPI